MDPINSTQITIISILIAGITGLWAYFTKREAEKEKAEKSSSNERESSLNQRIDHKDELIVQMVQGAAKSAAEVKSSIDNNTAAIKDLHLLTKSVMDELMRIKIMNARNN